MWKSFHNAITQNKAKNGSETTLTKEQLKNFAITQLTMACASEMLIFIKRFPLANEVKKYTNVVLCIAGLGEVLSNCWKEVENTKPQVLGRVAIVIESEIDIPILSIETEEANFMLSVEPLYSVKKS